jgi:hypothetical protein
MNSDSQFVKALLSSKTQPSSPTTQKIQTIEKRKKEEWEIEAKKEQYKANAKNYFNLTKRSEEQAKSIIALEQKVQKLERVDSKWKYIATGILVLATIELYILLKIIF